LKFRSLTLAVVGLIGLATLSPASAQSHRDPWTGFSVGASLSGLYGRGALEGVPVDPLKPHGLFYGLQVEYDMRLSEHLVFGALADINFGSAKDTVSDGRYLYYQAKPDRFGSLRAKLGYDVNGWLLPYLTAGAAWIHSEGSIGCRAGALGGVCLLTGPFKASSSQTDWGWTVGIGTEIALMKGWSAFVDYQYIDFGSPKTTITTPFATVSGRTNESTQVVQLGLKYRFQ
jgi:outer membrane immunogenic protein